MSGSSRGFECDSLAAWTEKGQLHCPPYPILRCTLLSPIHGAVQFTAARSRLSRQSQVFCRVCRAKGGLLQRPSHRTIGRPISLSMHEFIAARVKVVGNRALGGFPVVFLIE
jgi:hypothetical protein